MNSNKDICVEINNERNNREINQIIPEEFDPNVDDVFNEEDAQIMLQGQPWLTEAHGWLIGDENNENNEYVDIYDIDDI